MLKFFQNMLNHIKSCHDHYRKLKYVDTAQNCKLNRNEKQNAGWLIVCVFP